MIAGTLDIFKGPIKDNTGKVVFQLVPRTHKRIWRSRAWIISLPVSVGNREVVNSPADAGMQSQTKAPTSASSLRFATSVASAALGTIADYRSVTRCIADVRTVFGGEWHVIT